MEFPLNIRQTCRVQQDRKYPKLLNQMQLKQFGARTCQIDAGKVEKQQWKNCLNNNAEFPWSNIGNRHSREKQISNLPVASIRSFFCSCYSTMKVSDHVELQPCFGQNCTANIFPVLGNRKSNARIGTIVLSTMFYYRWRIVFLPGHVTFWRVRFSTTVFQCFFL